MMSTIRTLRASAAQTGAGTETGEWVSLNRSYREAIAQLIVSAAATEVGDLLDVYIDTSFDGGTTAVNIGRFTQVLGNGGAKTFVMSLCNANPGSSAVIDVTSSASAGATRQIGFGDKIRCRGIVTEASTVNTAFTYEVKVMVKE